MINDALIRNFKCFKSLTIPELGRITLISGRNNVGKTALIEALFLFFDQRNPSMTLQQYGRRGIEQVTLTTEAMWRPVFRNYAMNAEILISLTINGKQEQVILRFNREFVPPPPTTVQIEKQQIPTDEEFTTLAVDIEYTNKSGEKIISHHYADVNNQNRPTIVSKTAPSKILLSSASFFASKKHAPANEIAGQFSNLAREDRENEAVEFLKIIEPRLQGLKIIKEGAISSVHGKLEDLPQTIPINLMGEGMEKLLSLIVAIVHLPNRVILLDEMENGIFYAAMPKLWLALGKVLRKYECQLITTTHSRECLQAAYEGLSEMPEDFRYIRLDREGDDISAKLSNYKMLGVAIEHGLEIR